MIREILEMGDERLLRIAPPVPPEMFDSPELWQLIDDMFQTMEHVGGVGSSRAADWRRSAIGNLWF